MIEIVLCIFLIGTLLCEIAFVVAIFKMRHVLEIVANAWKERPIQISGGSTSPTDKAAGRGSVPVVDELPPHVIAPSLKKQVKSAGFGSSGGDKDGDTQLHERDSGRSGSQGSNKPSYPTPTDSTKAKTRKPTKGG